MVAGAAGEMRRLPLDTSSFRIIRTEGLLYVDKTRWIERMLNEGRYYFLSRPRRFGKSLTVSTLKELFSGNKELFKGLWIYERWDFRKYPVFLFDFNGIDSINPDVFRADLRYTIKQNLERYGLELKKETTGESIDKLFAEALNTVNLRYKQPVVILIDEYDRPILEHIGTTEEGLKIAEDNRRILKSFFGVLKEGNIVDIIRFVFVTGVSRFTKVSLFSEWNNLIDISMDERYTDFLGYTEEELQENFGEYLDSFCEEIGYGKDRCMEEFRRWYDGYRFATGRDVRVYNPVTVMYALRNRRFESYWFRTGTPTFLIKLLKEREYYIPELEGARYPFTIFDAFEVESLPVEVMFYQAGYVTIKQVRGDEVELGYPNLEVKKSFHEVLLKGLYDAHYRVYGLGRRLGEALRREEYSEVEGLINGIFESIPYTIYPKDEKAREYYYHSIIYLALSLLGYDVKTEVLSARGRLDMAVEFKERVYLLEFKVGRGAGEAVEQIKQRGYAERWRGEKRVIMCGISFDEARRVVKEVRFEPLQ